MKTLKDFESLQLHCEDLTKIRGKGNIFKDWLVGKAIDAVVDFIAYDHEGYGRRMYETGSPGGHK